MFLASLVLLVAVSSVYAAPRIIAQAKVSGQGFTMAARTGKACARLCEHQPNCDFANFELKTGKCKIFSRCAPSLIVYNSSSHIHFAKRPLIKEAGYKYHEESDSCLKVIDSPQDYAGADELCRSQNGRLVSVTDSSINAMSTELLKATGSQYAWIGATDSHFEGNPLLSDGQRVSDTGFFPTERQSFRRDPRRNCWSLSDSGTWSEHSCKTREQFSICQITAY